MGGEASEQPRLSYREMQPNMLPTTVGGCRHADDRCSEHSDNTSLQAIVSGIPDKTSKFAAYFQIDIVQLDWLHGEVEMDRRQHKQFDPGG